MADIQKLEQLQAWVQRTLPAVFDDSLSYYELLAKVLYVLNQTIATTNQVINKQQNDYTELEQNKVDKEDLINNMKLSPTGDFTGTWNGKKMTQVSEFIQVQVDENTSDIDILNGLVSLLQQNKRDKTTKLTSSDMDISNDIVKFHLPNLGEDIISAITGNVPPNNNIANNSVTDKKLAVKSVIPYKTNFLTVPNNLYDKNNTISGYYVDGTNGNLIPQIAQYPQELSNMIYVDANSVYSAKYGGNYACYGADGTFVGGSNSKDLTFTTPANSVYMYYSTDASNKDTQIIVKGTTIPYDGQFKLFMNSLKVQKSNIDFPMLSFSTGINKFNKDAITPHKFVRYTDGMLADEIPPYYYSAGDWIQVKTGDIIKFSSVEQFAFFDNNRNYVTGSNIMNSFQAPQDGWIRVSCATANLNSFMVQINTNYSEYYPFGYNIDYLLVPPHKHKMADITDLQSNVEAINVCLPSDIYVATNYPLEIFNKSIAQCGNLNNFHFKWSFAYGRSLKNRLVITPNASLNGQTFPCILDIYDNGLNKIMTVTSNIHFVKPTIALNPAVMKKILCVGDSLTDLQYWRSQLYQRLINEIGSNFSFIGTLGSDNLKHEGHSGWSINSYLTNTSEGWNGNYKVKVNYAIGTITPKKQYYFQGKLFEYEKTEVINSETWLYFNRLSGSGTIDTIGTCTEGNSSVSGASAINYTNATVTSFNPFFNPSTNLFDSKYYSDNLGSVPDYVILWLGANGLNTDTDKTTNLNNASSNITNLKKIVDDMLAKWQNAKIIVCYNHMWANQNGLGYASGTDLFDKGVELGVFNTNFMIKSTFEGYNSKVILAPVGQTFDSENNYPNQNLNVNLRNANYTEVQPLDRVHPDANTGFLQFSDSIYGTFINNI